MVYVAPSIHYPMQNQSPEQPIRPVKPAMVPALSTLPRRRTSRQKYTPTRAVHNDPTSISIPISCIAA